MCKEELLKYFDYIKSKADVARIHSPEHDALFRFYCKYIRRVIERYYTLDSIVPCYLGSPCIYQHDRKPTPKEWIPFTFDDDGLLDCALPETDEEILISDGKDVWIDTLMEDNGYYLDSGRELKGLAWMPLPEAHIKEN